MFCNIFRHPADGDTSAHFPRQQTRLLLKQLMRNLKKRRVIEFMWLVGRFSDIFRRALVTKYWTARVTSALL